MNKSGDVQQFSSKPGQLKVAQTIPDHLMWDPRLMCLKECLHFIFQSVGGWGYVVLTRFISFLSKTLFFVNDRTGEVFPSSLAEFMR